MDKKREMIFWLEKHGHYIEKSDEVYESITKNFKRLDFNEGLAFKLALNSYISPNSNREFYTDGNKIYVPFVADEIDPKNYLLKDDLKTKKRISQQRSNIRELLEYEPEKSDIDLSYLRNLV